MVRDHINAANATRLFYRIESLKVILEYILGRNYKYSQCGKTFSQNGTLISYMRTRMGNKPYIYTHFGNAYFTESVS